MSEEPSRSSEERDFVVSEATVPETWDEWWDSILALAKYGIDPYTMAPPPHITATGPRPAYTLPDYVLEDQ